MALALCFSANATLSVKYPCSDGMVLQQLTDALVWGHADPGAAVQVVTSWNKAKYNVKAGADGVFKAYVATPAASSEAYSIRVSSGKEKYEISDVLIGEVWIAGGQSNMEMPIRGFFNCPVEGASEVIAAAPNNNVRMFTVKIFTSYEPVADVQETDGWQSAGPESVSEMSAAAYFFARQLNQTLGIPVGIVAIPRGGSRVESWLPRATMESYGTEDCSPEGQQKRVEWARSCIMYNGMEQPVCGYTAKGFIWYQGCSNVGKAGEFVPRMVDMVRQWRSDWGDKDAKMPFYQVEIAPFQYGGGQFELAPALRAAQHESASVIPNCAIICTNDLAYPYEKHNIHPCQKLQVGQRLAYLALNREYGLKKLQCYSPEAVEITGGEGELIVKLSNCSNGLDRLAGIEGLEIAGEDGVFHPVTSVVFDWQKDTMHLKCDEVASPVKARYGWADFKPGNLHSSEGLPVVPFDLSLPR